MVSNCWAAPKVNFLLIRGLSRETRHWGEFPHMLAKCGGIGKLILLDLPGNGRYHKLNSPLRISEYTDFIREEWMKSQLAGPAGIIGVSLGGMVALDWVSRYADFQCAAIINSSSAIGTSIRERLRLQSLRELLGILLSSTIADQEEGILRLTVNDEKMVLKYLDYWQFFGKEFPFRKVNLLRQLVAAARFRPRRINNCQLLFLSSLADRLVSPSCNMALHKLLGGKLVTHATAGHDIPLDDPQWLCDQIIASFLKV